MAEESSDRFALPLLAMGQAQKEITHNEALARIDMLLHARAESLSQPAPPGAAVPGQCWIVAPGASGEWAGRDHCLAMLTAGGWRFVAPRAGLRIEVADEGMAYRHDGSSWLPEAVRQDGYYVDGQRIVGPRRDAIADPAGGSVVDVEVRAAMAQLLAALRSHGLIAEA